jgi:hypothetical protein
MSEKVSEQQRVIDELHSEATSPEDLQQLREWQGEHDKARARLGRPPESDPALRMIPQSTKHVVDTSTGLVMTKQDVEETQRRIHA